MSAFDESGGFPAYQRWEPTVLDPVEIVPMLQIPTAAELEAIQQQAHEEGYQAGLKEGAEEGAEAARLEREERLAEELLQLKALLEPLGAAVRDLDQVMGVELLALALEISRQMLRQALKVKPELMLPIVRSAMESLPQNTPHPHLHLNADDAALVRSLMQAEMTLGGWKIVEDSRITRGGCRIETPVSEIDATMESRWQRLAASLGQDTGWLDE